MKNILKTIVTAIFTGIFTIAANAQNEYYLTDTIKIAIGEGLRVNSFVADRPEVVMGANDREQLKLIEQEILKRRTKR